MQPQRQVTIGSTMLAGSNKEGVLKPDEDGYYTVVLGAYGTQNSAGMFYDIPSALAILKGNSPLLRMMEKGVLHAEWKHPEKLRGETDQEFIRRIRVPDPDRECAHIRNIHLQDSVDQQGRPMVLVIGEIKPSGPFGHLLKEKLDNKHENVYFSVRSITVDDVIRGIKYTREIITWDYVNEGGIYTAHKYASPALESFDEVKVTPEILWNLIDEQKRQRSLGLESTGMDYALLAKDLGWERLRSDRTRPVYTKW